MGEEVRESDEGNEGGDGNGGECVLDVEVVDFVKVEAASAFTSAFAIFMFSFTPRTP